MGGWVVFGVRVVGWVVTLAHAGWLAVLTQPAAACEQATVTVRHALHGVRCMINVCVLLDIVSCVLWVCVGVGVGGHPGLQFRARYRDPRATRV